MPWVIPPWLALVEFLGLTAKKYDEHDDNKATMSTMIATAATATAATPTTWMVAMMETMMKVTWMVMAVATTTTTMMTSTTTMTTTAMGRQQCDGDNDDGTTTMEQRQCDGDGLVSAVPPIRGINQLMLTVWGGVDQKEGRFWGTEGPKWVEVEAIGWRSLHLHSINSKLTFYTPSSGKRMGSYSACVLGVRLCCRCHGEHV